MKTSGQKDGRIEGQKDKRTDITALFYLFKVINGNTRPICEICSKLTIKKEKRFVLVS